MLNSNGQKKMPGECRSREESTKILDPVGSQEILRRIFIQIHEPDAEQNFINAVKFKLMALLKSSNLFIISDPYLS